MPIKRTKFLSRAVDSYQAQNWKDRELVIYETGGLGGAAWNEGCRRAKGDVICIFADDDWSAPNRVTYQALSLMVHNESHVTAFNELLYWNDDEQQAYGLKLRDGEAAGYSLCFTKSFWLTHPFDETIPLGYAGAFKKQAREEGVMRATASHNLIWAGMHADQTSAGHLTGLEKIWLHPKFLSHSR